MGWACSWVCKAGRCGRCRVLCGHAAWAGHAAGCARLVGVGAVGCCVGMLHGLGMQLGVQGW